jgi:hypothetical protein
LSFTGISQFSNDFQTILNRAVAIAQLPVTALQNQQANILQEKQLSTSFETAVSALAATVTNLGAIGASSSDTSKVTIASTSATSPASYSITNITSGSRGSVRNLRDWIRQLHGHAGFEQRYGEVGSGRQF